MSKSKASKKSERKECMLRFRVEPYVKHWVDTTVKNPQVPFCDKTEFLYWCLMEGFKKLKNEHPDEDVLADYALHRARVDIDRSIDRENACIHLLEETRQRVKYLITRQAYDELQILLQKMKINIDLLPITPETIKTKKQWDLEFGKYVETTPPASSNGSDPVKPNGKPRVSLWPEDFVRE